MARSLRDLCLRAADIGMEMMSSTDSATDSSKRRELSFSIACTWLCVAGRK